VWTVEAADVFSPDGAALLRAYFTEVVDRYHGRPMPASLVDQAMEDEPSDGLAAFFVARYDGAPAGCAGLTASGELTRLYIAPPFRRRGGARVLLTAVEDAARWHGFPRIRLDTRHDLVEARELYRSCGYAEVPAFNDGPYSEHWFAKRLN
jgi:GNAT superfamily N-acetyltransferase